MRRGLLVAVGILLAFLTASVVLVAGAAVLVAGASLETSRAMLAAAAWAMAMPPGEAAPPVAQVGGAIWRTLITLALGPIGIVAALGEVTGRRGLLGLSLSTGLMAVLCPLAWTATHDTGRVVALEGSGRVLAVLFLSGVASGGTYWLIAGMSASARPA